MEQASLFVHKKTKSLKEAVKWAKVTFGATLSKCALKKHAHRKPCLKPKKQGGQPVLPEEQEQRFIGYIRLFRLMKLPMRRDIMPPILNKMLEGTGLQNRFKNKEVTKYWWWSFCKRHHELFGTKRGSTSCRESGGPNCSISRNFTMFSKECCLIWASLFLIPSMIQLSSSIRKILRQPSRLNPSSSSNPIALHQLMKQRLHATCLADQPWDGQAVRRFLR